MNPYVFAVMLLGFLIAVWVVMLWATYRIQKAVLRQLKPVADAFLSVERYSLPSAIDSMDESEREFWAERMEFQARVLRQDLDR